MHKLKIQVLAVAVVLAAATVSFAQTDKTKHEIEIRATLSIPSGEANFSGTGAAGSTIDFNRDADLSNEWGFDIKYAYRTTDGKHKVGVEYANADWTRTRVIGRS